MVAKAIGDIIDTWGPKRADSLSTIVFLQTSPTPL